MKIEIPKFDKIVLLGGGNVLISLSKWCLSQNIKLIVLTSPRQAQEINKENQSLTKFLEKNSIPFLISKDINQDKNSDLLSELSTSFCLSVGAAWIFKTDIIRNTFKNRLFNLHGTRLPQNRGGGGFSWQIMMGNRLGFCQLHLIDGNLDTGDIIKTKEFLYPPTCRIPKDYEQIYLKENMNFLKSFIKIIRMKNIVLETNKQLEYFSTYWPRLNTPLNGWLNWNEKINSLERFICSFDEPYEGAKTYINDKKVFIKDVMIDYSDPQFHNFQYGIIYRKGPSWISVCANGGSLIIRKVLDEYNNNIYNKIKIGDRFITPLTLLEERFKRVSYSSLGIN